MPENKSQKNCVRSSLDQSIIAQIRQDLTRPAGDYNKNLRGVKEVDWLWKHGSTKTAITYSDGGVDQRANNNPPPTRACHDIAHFMAALNGSLEWDYMQEINHLCEFNAVAVENLMTYCCHSIKKGGVLDTEQNGRLFLDHMKWFSEDYYHIPKRHPSGKKHAQLVHDFLETAHPQHLSRYFGIFYEVWSIENVVGGPGFEVSVTMTSDIEAEFPRVEAMLNAQLESIRELVQERLPAEAAEQQS